MVINTRMVWFDYYSHYRDLTRDTISAACPDIFCISILHAQPKLHLKIKRIRYSLIVIQIPYSLKTCWDEKGYLSIWICTIIMVTCWVSKTTKKVRENSYKVAKTKQHRVLGKQRWRADFWDIISENESCPLQHQALHNIEQSREIWGMWPKAPQAKSCSTKPIHSREKSSEKWLMQYFEHWLSDIT